MLRFAEIFEKLSKTYEIDLGYKVSDCIDELKRGIRHLNDELQCMAEEIGEASYRMHDIAFLADTLVEDMLIDLEKINPSSDETGVHYINEFKKILGEDF